MTFEMLNKEENHSSGVEVSGVFSQTELWAAIKYSKLLPFDTLSDQSLFYLFCCGLLRGLCSRA